MKRLNRRTRARGQATVSISEVVPFYFTLPSLRSTLPGEGDEKRLATQHFKTARPLQLAGVVGGVATGEIVRSSEGR